MRRYIGVICWMIYGLGMLTLIGYLCTLFHSAWFILLVLTVPNYHDNEKIAKKDSDESDDK